jgi:hypothetical protein
VANDGANRCGSAAVELSSRPTARHSSRTGYSIYFALGAASRG